MPIDQPSVDRRLQFSMACGRYFVAVIDIFATSRADDREAELGDGSKASEPSRARRITNPTSKAKKTAYAL